MPDPGLVEPLASIDAQRLQRLAGAWGREFREAVPFPHLVIDDFLKPEVAEAILSEFRVPADQAVHWKHYNENKHGLTRIDLMGPATQGFIREVSSPRFTAFLEELTGIGPLLADPDLDGAGLHETPPGGFLNMHVDFLSHTLRSNWSRQLNLLLYLNKDWKEEYNGFIEFWDMKEKKRYRKVKPAFNRCVLFQTTRTSWHGYPARLACPPGTTRKSIALYYYREEAAPLALNPTFYQYLPDDPLAKKALVVLDRWALKVYSFIKRRSLISDRVVSAVLRFLR
ncbi:MAG: 2OG-Fe(II) oxygenase [Elusimicrobia bacterium]|nr:2OG-Fe(II) oxygenase [Elusimicrobiota bacterium]